MAAAMLAAGGIMASSVAATVPDARSVVQKTTDEVLTALRKDQDLYKKDPKQVYRLVEDVILPHFDFVQMSRRVLGRYWRTATEEQKKRFVDQFRRLLVRTYSTALVDYSGSNVTVLPVHAEAGADDVIVRSRVNVPAQAPIQIAYSMFREGDDWKVYDVTIDGVSLVITYRASFSTEINRNGLDSLIDRLVQLNDKDVKEDLKARK